LKEIVGRILAGEVGDAKTIAAIMVAYHMLSADAGA